MMTFVCTGTWLHGFPRLLRGVRKAVGLGELRGTVLVQCPLHQEEFAEVPDVAIVNSLTPAAYHEALASADLVITHAAVSALQAVSLGRRVVAVPRLARFGEARDDHQVAFSEMLAKRGGVVIAEPDFLGAAILQALGTDGDQSCRNGAPQLVISLKKLLDTRFEILPSEARRR